MLWLLVKGSNPTNECCGCSLAWHTICLMLLGWKRCCGSLPSAAGSLPEPLVGVGWEALPGGLGTHRLEAPSGRDMAVLAGEGPCGCYMGGAPGSVQPSPAAPDGSPTAALTPV